jgi:hypothetical protein
MVLLVGVAVILTSDDAVSTCCPNEGFFVAGIAVLLGLAFAMITGWANIVSKRRISRLVRPSFSSSPFDKNVVLQFQHFASYFFILLGTAGVFRSWSMTNIWEPLEIPAFGLGLLLGTSKVLRMFQGRFTYPTVSSYGIF